MQMHQQQQQHSQQHQQQQQQQQQRQLHDEQHSANKQQSHCHTHSAYAEHMQQQQKQPTTPHRHQPQQQQHQQQQQQRKHSHSHSPHPSRHTSPHSHHSHSLHSSPHQSHNHVHEIDSPSKRQHNTPLPRPSTQSSSSHAAAHHHHNHRRRRRQHNHQHHATTTNGGGGTYNGSGNGNGGGGSGNSSIHGPHGSNSGGGGAHRHHHAATCTKRHRSVTDVSSTSINTCHDPSCTDREVQDILVRKNCCSTSSRTELAQYFAEDLYGTSRRPSSCCTSSDYCYQTDSTSLYGSRSSLSRNNSIKSASVAMRKRRMHQRQPSYTSISLRGLNASRPSSQMGSLTSIFDRSKQLQDKKDINTSGKIVLSPSKVTIERHTSKDALSNDLPEYACSPSPIRWSFLADNKSPTDFLTTNAASESDTKDAWTPEEQQSTTKYECEQRSRTWKSATCYDERPSTSAAARKQRESPFSYDCEESTTVLFHQEGEAYNNCCNNYIQCNTYLDHDLQITSEDIHQYLSKGNQQSGDVLNNSKNYPFQPSNALEFQYKNNFANNNNNTAASSEGGDSMRGYDGRFRRNSSKETNLNQNVAGDTSDGLQPSGGCAASSCSSTPLSPTNINLSSSTNNINIVFNASCMERNANEVKFINTTRENVVSSEAHHSGYLPYTYPTYDYTNMSSNSFFDKPLGIGELPKDFARETTAASCAEISNVITSGEQNSSPLLSPVQPGVSFDSFDAASDHNLISLHGSSCQFSSTPRSPLSPASPATSSCLSASINPATASYVHPTPQAHRTHYSYYDYHQPQPQQQQSSSSPHTARHRHHQQQYHHHHFTESFKFSNAFKKVRKRARKYTDFLRKK